MRLNLPAKACLLDGTRCRYKDIAFPVGLIPEHRSLREKHTAGSLPFVPPVLDPRLQPRALDVVNAPVRHDLELRRGRRDGTAAGRIAANMRQIQMRRVV